MVEITQDFIETQLGDIEYQRIKNSKGLNYCSENILGLQLVGAKDVIPKDLLDEALRIFYFDLIIQNPDRTNAHGKPNLFTTGNDLWVLDHEIAFSFLTPIIGRPKTAPWELHESDIKMITNHILYRRLKNSRLNFNVLENYLDNIDEFFWERMTNIIPASWMSDDFDKIVNHITGIKNNQQLLLTQIKTLLS